MSRTVSLEELHTLAVDVLCASNTSAKNAGITADALVAADADGLSSHGVSRIPFYADQARVGKVDGHAVPRVQSVAEAVVRVDARYGFAYPAIRAGMDEALQRIGRTGIVSVAIANSHHFGAAGYHVESLAAQGYIALGFSNSPAAMAPWGGRRGSLGTNPIAFACPRQDVEPLVIDLSLSQVARGKIVRAAQLGEAIPEGWALDNKGGDTTDAKAALAGTMMPAGGAKGAALALMVEILSAALTGSNFAFQASSFFDADGGPPGIGQLFLLLNPEIFAAGFVQRLELLIDDLLVQEGVRLPGERRLLNRRRAQAGGVEIADDVYGELLRRRAAL